MKRRRDNGVPTPASMCLHCGYAVDRASQINGRKAHPKPGDFSLCLKCGAVLQFSPELRLQQADMAAWRQFQDEEPETAAKALAAQWAILRMPPWATAQPFGKA